MRIPSLRSDAPFLKRVHDAVWRLRHDLWVRPSLLDRRWMDERTESEVRRRLAERPIVLLDLGARGYVQDLRELRDVTRVFGFEPNEEQCEPLTRAWHAAGYREARFAPLAVWSDEGRRTLRITRSPGSISFFEPDRKALEPFGSFAGLFELVGAEEVATTSLDVFARAQGLDYVDMVKMDVQGSELEAIAGGAGLLRGSTLLVKTEIWFRRLYSGGPVFREVDEALAALGFQLLAIDNVQYPSSVRSRGSVDSDTGDRGEWLWGDGIYVKDVVLHPELLPVGDPGALTRLALILESTGFVGYALDLARVFADREPLLDGIANAIRNRHRIHRYERGRAAAILPGRFVRSLAGRDAYTDHASVQPAPR